MKKASVRRDSAATVERQRKRGRPASGTSKPKMSASKGSQLKSDGAAEADSGQRRSSRRERIAVEPAPVIHRDLPDKLRDLLTSAFHESIEAAEKTLKGGCHDGESVDRDKDGAEFAAVCTLVSELQTCALPLAAMQHTCLTALGVFMSKHKVAEPGQAEVVMRVFHEIESELLPPYQYGLSQPSIFCTPMPLDGGSQPSLKPTRDALILLSIVELAISNNSTATENDCSLASLNQRCLSLYPQWLIDHSRFLGPIHQENVEFQIRVDILCASLEEWEARHLGIVDNSNAASVADRSSAKNTGGVSDSSIEESDLRLALEHLEAAKTWLSEHARAKGAKFQECHSGDHTLNSSEVASDSVITDRLQALTDMVRQIKTHSAFLEGRYGDVASTLQPMIPASLVFTTGPTSTELSASTEKFLVMLQKSCTEVGDVKGKLRCAAYCLILQLHRLFQASATKGLLDASAASTILKSRESLEGAVNLDELTYITSCIARLVMSKHRVLCREGGDFAATIWVLLVELCDHLSVLREDSDDAMSSASSSEEDDEDETTIPAMIQVLELGFLDLLGRDAVSGAKWIVPRTLMDLLNVIPESRLSRNPNLLLLRAQCMYALYHFKSKTLAIRGRAARDHDIDVVAKCEKQQALPVDSFGAASALARFILDDLDGSDIDNTTRQVLEEQVVPFFDLRNQGSSAARVYQRIERFVSGASRKKPAPIPGITVETLSVRLFDTLQKRKTGEELSWPAEMGYAMQQLALLPKDREGWARFARRCVNRLRKLPGSDGDAERGPARDRVELKWLVTAASRA